ncbi:MAG: dynamin family protein [Candidatus Cloacimonadaceae bacterium]|jgi:GTPase Era involved in 16S rRNA processing
MKHVNVRLTRNPYLDKTDLSVNDEPILEGPLKELINSEKHPQVWMSRFFPVLHDYCNVDSYKVCFMGIEQDYYDLLNEAKQAISDLRISIDIEHVLKDKTDPERIMFRLRELFKEAKLGPIDEFNTEEINLAFEHALKPEIEIYCVATISAGKSTLINAFLGQDLQLSEKSACTVTISRIEDYDNMEHFRGRACYDEGKIGEWVNVSKEIMEKWNKDNVPLIELRGDIPMISSYNIRLVLVDTPSLSNSMDPQHKNRILDAITRYRKKVILYVLDATQFSENDDQELIKAVSQDMMRGGKQAYDRLIFVLNKIDEIDHEEEDIRSILDKVRDCLESNGIPNPNIYPISANLTKLIRCEMNGIKLDKEEKQIMEKAISMFTEIDAMDMIQYMPLSSTVKKTVQKRINDAKKDDNLKELAMLKSGVPVLEEVIQEYLFKHALPAGIYEARMSFEFMMTKYDIQARIDEELEKSKDNLGRISEQLKEAEKNYFQGEKANQFRVKMKGNKWIESREYSDRISSIKADFQKDLNKFERRSLAWKMRDPKAKDMMRDLENDANRVIASIQVEIEGIIRSEVESMVEDFKKKDAKELFSELGDASKIIEGLSKSVELMLEKGKTILSLREQMSQIDITKKPILLGLSKPNVSISSLEYYKYPDLLRNWLVKSKTKSEGIGVEMFKACREYLIEQVAVTIKETIIKVSSKLALEKAIRENAKKKEWLDGFQQELDNILTF